MVPRLLSVVSKVHLRKLVRAVTIGKKGKGVASLKFLYEKVKFIELMIVKIHQHCLKSSI